MYLSDSLNVVGVMVAFGPKIVRAKGSVQPPNVISARDRNAFLAHTPCVKGTREHSPPIFFLHFFFKRSTWSLLSCIATLKCNTWPHCFVFVAIAAWRKWAAHSGKASARVRRKLNRVFFCARGALALTKFIIKNINKIMMHMIYFYLEVKRYDQLLRR